MSRCRTAQITHTLCQNSVLGVYHWYIQRTCGQREIRLGHKSLHKLYIFSTEDVLGMLATGFQTKFIPVQSAFGAILVADVLHYQVSLFGLMRVGFVVSSWHILVLDTWLIFPSWFLPNSALTLFFICWECLSICAFLPSQLEQLLIHFNYFDRGFGTGNSLGD